VARRKQLGEFLVENKLVTYVQLQEALRIQKNSAGRLGEILVNLGYVTEKDIMDVLEFQLGIDQVDLLNTQVDPEVINKIPESMIRRHRVIPIAQAGNVLTVAMADPLNIVAADDIKVATGLEVKPVMVAERSIDKTIQKFFGMQDLMSRAFDLDQISENLSDHKTFKLDEMENQMMDEAPIVRVVNSVIGQAVQKRASDIHIEPHEETVRIRMRIDGLLRDYMNLPRDSHPSLISRIKIMAGMDIAEKRIPQDGRIRVHILTKEVDLRISTLPTIFGEKAVLRILDKGQLMLSLDELGFSPAAGKRFKEMISSTYGMVLVTGPTGSGKTTTLYTTLNAISTPDLNIIAVEDPVEYVLGGINQVQVNMKSGLSFAAGLRSILRQDPDVVMVGEIRDGETASIAIRAATTGHLVFSTLHTNDAPGALTRLIDMGAEPFLVASSVVGVVAQRLVRRICGRCRTTYQLDSEDPARLYLGVGQNETVELYRGEGCGYCDHTGFRGRLSIHEVLPLSPKLRSLVAREGQDQLRQTAIAEGMATLKEDGIDKAFKGLTTIQEVMRVAHSDQVID